MRFIIYGAGGIGGVLGARLFQAGFDVVLIARGAHYEALRDKGLRLQTPDEDVLLPIPVIDHPAKLHFRPTDLVFLTMKSQHTATVMEPLRAAAGCDIPVICCQNGVANERLALRFFSRVYAMVVIMPANHLEPGIVQTNARTTTGILDAGRYPGGVDGTITEVCAALERAGFSARPDGGVMAQKYAKLLTNLGNALEVISQPDPGWRDLARQLKKEALQCYAAACLPCATVDEVRHRRDGVFEMGTIGDQERGRGSSWQSIRRGQGSVECDYLNGEIVQLGRLHGVPTPANLVLQEMAAEVARQGWPAGSVEFARVEKRIRQAAGAGDG